MLAISMKSGRETDEESLHFLSRRRPEEGFLGGYCFSNMFITTGSGELGVNHSFSYSRIVIALIPKIKLKITPSQFASLRKSFTEDLVFNQT